MSWSGTDYDDVLDRLIDDGADDKAIGTLIAKLREPGAVDEREVIPENVEAIPMTRTLDQIPAPAPQAQTFTLDQVREYVTGLQADNAAKLAWQDFKHEADLAKERYADIVERPEMYKYWIKRDAARFKADPSQPAAERLADAADDVYRRFGTGEDFDAKEAIANDPRVARGHGLVTPFKEVEDEPRTGDEKKYYDDNSEVIAGYSSRTQGHPAPGRPEEFEV